MLTQYLIISEQFRDYHNVVKPIEMLLTFRYNPAATTAGLIPIRIKSLICGYSTWSFSQDNIFYLRIIENWCDIRIDVLVAVYSRALRFYGLIFNCSHN
jgi:hypothetical protein